MNKKSVLIFGSIIALTILGLAGKFAYENLRGIGPLLLPPNKDIVREITVGNMPLKLSSLFDIEVFADKLPNARAMAFDGVGNVWVSQTQSGTISLLEVKNNQVINKTAVFKGLNLPHGIAFDPDEKYTLYYAEETRLSKVQIYTEGTPRKLAELPKKGNHFTRTLGFGPDGRLYISIGSTCNVCVERDKLYASIVSTNKQGRDVKTFARGLRNSVFFAWNPKDNKMFATEMGRDLLGDDLPPDEFNIIEEGKNYGWPYCYGKNVHDDKFDSKKKTSCDTKTGSFIDLPAHSAPLGLAFINDSRWPEEYQGDLLVAYHGSWNRTVPDGYKIVRHKFGSDGNYEGAEDFITGWLKDNSALGRPVDLKFGPDGSLYVSDDKAGVIYRVKVKK